MRRPSAECETERFPSRIRASGFGVGYSLALALPAFYSFYLTPVVLIVIAGALVSIGGALGPEPGTADLRR